MGSSYRTIASLLGPSTRASSGVLLRLSRRTTPAFSVCTCSQSTPAAASFSAILQRPVGKLRAYAYERKSGTLGRDAAQRIDAVRGFATSSSKWAAQRDGDRDGQTTKPLSKLRQKLSSMQSRENIYTVPNILTFSRLIAAPAVGYLVLHDQHAWAFGLFAYAGITDLVDGWIARKWNLQTVVGSVVDPMADKILMTILVGCLALQGSLPLPLATLILGRDASLAIAAIYYRWTSLPAPKTLARYWDFSLPSAEVHPTNISKWNTFLQLGLIGFTLAAPLLVSSSSSTDEAGNPSQAASSSLSHSPAEGHTDTASGPASTSASTSTAVTSLLPYFQGLVAATTLWSGASYTWTRDAVRILGTDETLKRKQGIRGRAVVGVSFAIVVAAAAVLWVGDLQRQEKANALVDMGLPVESGTGEEKKKGR